MPTTTRGFRYPDGTVKVGQLDTAIQNLAEDVDTKIGKVQKGTATIDIVTVSVGVDLVVVFASAFPAGVTPIVVATINGASNDNRFLSVKGVTNTQFTISGLNKVNNADLVANWIAIG